MPVYLRRFYSNALLEEKERERKAIEKSQKTDTNQRIPFQTK